MFYSDSLPPTIYMSDPLPGEVGLYVPVRPRLIVGLPNALYRGETIFSANILNRAKITTALSGL